jgi:hypothetical protein
MGDLFRDRSPGPSFPILVGWRQPATGKEDQKRRDIFNIFLHLFSLLVIP